MQPNKPDTHYSSVEFHAKLEEYFQGSEEYYFDEAYNIDGYTPDPEGYDANREENPDEFFAFECSPSIQEPIAEEEEEEEEEEEYREDEYEELQELLPLDERDPISEGDYFYGERAVYVEAEPLSYEYISGRQALMYKNKKNKVQYKQMLKIIEVLKETKTFSEEIFSPKNIAIILLLPAMYEIQQKFNRGCRNFVLQYKIEKTTGIKFHSLHRILQEIFYYAEVENLTSEIKDKQDDNGLEKRYTITLTDENSWTKERIERQSKRTTYIEIEPLSIFLLTELMEIGVEQFRTFFTIQDEPWVEQISLLDLQKVYSSLNFAGDIRALKDHVKNKMNSNALAVKEKLLPKTTENKNLQALITNEKVSHWANELVRDIHAYLENAIEWSLIETGAILTGDPGTGKTTLAKAIAKDSGINFIQVSASADWIGGGYLSNCINNIQTTFEEAKKQQPCIIFVDELDGLGTRDREDDGRSEWNKWIVNAVLTEIDNIKECEIILLGATNYINKVDSAIKRSGRFGKIINVPLPNKHALKEIYKLKIAKFTKGEMSVSDEVLDTCVSHSVGKSGADVEEVVKSVVKIAKTQGRSVSADDFIKEIYGLPEVLPKYSEEDPFISTIATHEVGHALVAYAVGTLDVEFITIIHQSRQAGWVTIVPKGADIMLREIKNRLCVYLAGRAAEEVYFGEDGISTGAGGGPESDLYKAKALAQDFYGNFGLGGIDKITVPKDEDVQQLLTTEYERAKSIIRQYPKLFAQLRTELIRRNYLFRHEVDTILSPLKQPLRLVNKVV